MRACLCVRVYVCVCMFALLINSLPVAKLENNESEQNDLLKRVTDRVGNGNRVPTKDLSLERWLLGESYASDEYDTDLEEDFPPG